MLRKSLPFLFILLAMIVLVWTLPQCSYKPRPSAIESAKTTAPTETDTAQPAEQMAAHTSPRPEPEPQPAEPSTSEPAPDEATIHLPEPPPVPPDDEQSDDTSRVEAQPHDEKEGDSASMPPEAEPPALAMDEPVLPAKTAPAPTKSIDGNDETTGNKQAARHEEPGAETPAPLAQQEKTPANIPAAPLTERKHEEEKAADIPEAAGDRKHDAGATIILDGVNFESDSDQMMPGSEVVLDNVIESLMNNPNIKLEIAGYTDDRGDPLYNRILSRRRAEAVMIYLVDHGIDARRLTAAGYGSDNPIADNRTHEGRQKNRRVELHIR